MLFPMIRRLWERWKQKATDRSGSLQTDQEDFLLKGFYLFICFLSLFIFNWRIIALQYSIGFHHIKSLTIIQWNYKYIEGIRSERQSA